MQSVIEIEWCDKTIGVKSWHFYAKKRLDMTLAGAETVKPQ